MNRVLYIRLTPGFANQLYEYMAAYALARKMDRELILDVSLCMESQNAYLIDVFCIPECKKVWYPLDAQYRSHPCIESIPDYLRRKSYIVSDVELNCEFYFYQGLDTICLGDIPEDKDIFMCGWFFGRKYYSESWEELRGFLRLKKEIGQLERLKKQIEGRESVGIHIRRGDFQTCAMSGSLLADDFWRAAVVWFRKKYKNCIFYVFSDDIGYAERILGNADDITYIHFGNNDSAAVCEFLCLSMCRHKVQSNGSTFSGLADEIKSQTGRIAVKMDKNFSSYRWTSKIRITAEKISLYYKKRNSERKEVGFNEADVRWLSRKYVGGSEQNMSDKISGLEWDLGEFLAYADQGMYDMALDMAYGNYVKWRSKKFFQERLIKILTDIGYYEEAAVEAVAAGVAVKENKELFRMLACQETIHFVIVPGYKSFASTRIVELLHLGIVLFHLGHRVSLVMEPVDFDEEVYMRKSRVLTTRISISLGPEQYVWQDVMEQGVEGFLSDISQPGERLVIVSRREQFLDQQLAPVIFPDYSYRLDAEREGQTTGKRLSVEADYVLTCNTKLSGNRIIHYSPKNMPAGRNGLHMETEMLLDKQHRLSVRHIYMAAAMISRLKTI